MAKLPLEGIRILDYTVAWAGPFAGQMLADLGAEYILIDDVHLPERGPRGVPKPPYPLTGSMARAYNNSDARERAWEKSSNWLRHRRNSLSVCIDTGKPGGKEVFSKLVQKSDGLLSNSVDMLERRGINWEWLKGLNPRFIYVAMPIFGFSGPYKNFMGFGDNVEAMISHAWLMGYPDERHPRDYPGTFSTDASAGGTACLAMLLALEHRRLTGKGQFVEACMAESGIPHFDQAMLDYTMNGRVQRAIGNRDPSMVQGIYRCRGEDRWITITISSDEEWAGLCQAMNNPAWTKEERFGDALNRYKNHDELDKLIEEWTKQYDHYHLFHILQSYGVTAGPLMDARDVTRDPQLLARGCFEVATRQYTGSQINFGPLYKMSRTPLKVRRPAPTLGQHNDYIFKDVIGMSDEEITALEKDFAIGGTDYVPE